MNLMPRDRRDCDFDTALFVLAKDWSIATDGFEHVLRLQHHRSVPISGAGFSYVASMVFWRRRLLIQVRKLDER